MAKVKITLVKSKNGTTKSQQACLASLGIRRINHFVELELNPVYNGMLQKILHLVKVEEIN